MTGTYYLYALNSANGDSITFVTGDLCTTYSLQSAQSLYLACQHIMMYPRQSQALCALQAKMQQAISVAPSLMLMGMSDSSAG